MRRQPSPLWIVCGLFLTGCLSSRGGADLLQARLREQEQTLADVQSRLTAQERSLATARHEADELRRQLAQSGGGGLLPEQSDLLTRVAGIKINAMLTAGIDRDEISGDDALCVQFAPLDTEGELVKLPGAIEVAVLDPSLPERERSVAKWTFTPEETRKHWTRASSCGLSIHVALAERTAAEFRAGYPRQIEAGGWPRIHGNARGEDQSAGDRGRTPPDSAKTRWADGSTAAVPATLRRPPITESTNWTEGNMPVRR